MKQALHLRTALAALFCAALLSPASGFSQTTAKAEKLSSDWKRVTSGDLIAVGNAPEKELRGALWALEDFRFALRHVFPKLRVTSEVPTIIVVFKGNSSFHRFKPRDERGRIRDFVGGYFQAHADVNYMVMPASAHGTLSTLFHEYTHYVVHRNLSSVPAWLNEGLAEFYSTFRSDYSDGRGLIGAPPEYPLALIRRGPMLPLREMLSNQGASRIFREERRISMFYAQSWALVHYLHMARWATGFADLNTYLRALESGSVDDAVKNAFGVTLQELESELHGYVRQSEFSGVLLPKRPQQEAAELAAARMLESEARYLQGDLLVRVGAEEEAEQELKRALADDPSHSGAQVSLGRARVQQERVDEGIAILEAAAARDPSNFSAQYYLAAAYHDGERYDDALRAFDAALKLQSRSAAVWFGISLSALALGREAQADSALKNVLTLDSDAQWFRRRSYAAYDLGRYTSIVRDTRSFLDQLGWGDESAPYLALLAAVASWRQDRAADAEAILAEAGLTVKADSWPFRLVSFMRGELAADSLLSRAKNNDERTEAHAYIGIKAALGGRPDEARKHLQWVKDRGSRHYVEYDMAVADLKRLDTSK